MKNILYEVITDNSLADCIDDTKICGKITEYSIIQNLQSITPYQLIKVLYTLDKSLAILNSINRVFGSNDMIEDNKMILRLNQNNLYGKDLKDLDNVIEEIQKTLSFYRS